MAEKQAQAPEQTSSASFNDIEEVEALSGADESANLVVIRKNWPLLVETVREKKKTAAGVLSGAVPSGYSGGVLRIAVKDDYSKSSLESETCQTPIKEAFKSIFKKQISLVIVKDIATKEGKTAAPAVRPEGGKEKAVDPIVDAANKLFGGRIMRKDEHGKL